MRPKCRILVRKATLREPIEPEKLNNNQDDPPRPAPRDTDGARVADVIRASGIVAPRQVLLFSGHMIDAPDRPSERFPAALEASAAAEIDAALGRLGASPADIGFTQGACGGDLLFAEACISRGIPLTLLLPLAETEFVRQSVAFAGAHWVDRFHAVKADPGTRLFDMATVLGPTPADQNVFERANRWLLESALAFGREKLRVITLWDGRGGDGPGGTRHMLDEVRRGGGRIVHLRPQDLKS
jgi:hypothetical protein